MGVGLSFSGGGGSNIFDNIASKSWTCNSIDLTYSIFWKSVKSRAAVPVIFKLSNAQLI
jgi:hypothetical protein